MSRFLWAIALLSVALLTGCATGVTTTSLNNAAQSGNYEVAGAVLHPGVFHLTPEDDLTLAEVIRRSGGFKPGNGWDDGGDPNHVQVKRLVNGSMVEYTLEASPGGRDENFPIQAGDYINVPKRSFSTPISNPLPYAN